ncbi:hypothetical protein AB6A40_002592 [Gnathostoma spinigerum]|uniref:Uncharacterized protein n=1 Tax=Gnathostoma spinigerum TaxID=75299 RepID=A0ABD6EG32_9BILA
MWRNSFVYLVIVGYCLTGSTNGNDSNKQAHATESDNYDSMSVEKRGGGRAFGSRWDLFDEKRGGGRSFAPFFSTFKDRPIWTTMLNTVKKRGGARAFGGGSASLYDIPTIFEEKRGGGRRFTSFADRDIHVEQRGGARTFHLSPQFELEQFEKRGGARAFGPRSYDLLETFMVPNAKRLYDFPLYYKKRDIEDADIASEYF